MHVRHMRLLNAKIKAQSDHFLLRSLLRLQDPLFDDYVPVQRRLPGGNHSECLLCSGVECEPEAEIALKLRYVF